MSCSRRCLIALWALAIAGLVGDVATTWYGITQLGVEESNPIVVAMMGHIGLLPTAVLLKGLVLVVGVWSHRRLNRIGGPIWMPPVVLIAIHAAVVLNNAVLIASVT